MNNEHNIQSGSLILNIRKKLQNFKNNKMFRALPHICWRSES